MFEEAMIFPDPTRNIRLKVEFVAINSCTSQHFILGNDYLNIYNIDYDNHEDRYVTMEENKRQKISFPLTNREITVIMHVKDFHKEQFVSDQLVEAQISAELTPEMKEEII
ncbi:hypothetical protein O181_116683 [Austropuccinia psidii MF-1]|uniref:Uncharacterized protein n=1 Tax=Austropuccinia psidii MF-1 TaxID=1389203 RepID=A0A9Q3K8V4_9BASI|nr:hypothetical protein [Austropuccinia psidii MF-1]